MSYISGLGGATSAYPTDQPVDQQERYGAARTATGPDGRSVVPDLYPRRPLGQRLTDISAVTERLRDGREFVYVDTYEMPAVAGAWLAPQVDCCAAGAR